MLQSMRSSAKYIFWFIAITFIGGFLLVDTSGLLGRAPVSTGTTVATVNGEDITFAQWQAAIENVVRQEEARAGTSVVASGDRDTFQLASERTTILQPDTDEAAAADHLPIRLKTAQEQLLTVLSPHMVESKGLYRLLTARLSLPFKRSAKPPIV